MYKLFKKPIKTKIDYIQRKSGTNNRVGVRTPYWRRVGCRSSWALVEQRTNTIALSAQASQRLHQPDSWRCVEWSSRRRVVLGSSRIECCRVVAHVHRFAESTAQGASGRPHAHTNHRCGASRESTVGVADSHRRDGCAGRAFIRETVRHRRCRACVRRGRHSRESRFARSTSISACVWSSWRSWTSTLEKCITNRGRKFIFFFIS